jgi:ATP-dependent Lon protease
MFWLLRTILLPLLLISPELSAMRAIVTFGNACEEFYAQQTASGVCMFEELKELQKGETEDEKIKREHNYNVLARRCKSLAQNAMVVGIGSGACYYLMSNPNFLMFAGLISMGFRDKIEAYTKSFQQAMSPSPEMIELDETELKLALSKNISRDRRAQLDGNINSVRDRLARITSYNETEIKRELKRLKAIVSLPTETKVIDSSKTQAICQSIEQAMGSTYDQSLVDNIKLLAYQIIRDSNRSSDGPQKSMYYFLGVPGTGKTTTAKLIAQVLGLPFFSINLSKIQANDLTSPGKIDGTDSKIAMGKIAECFLSEGATLNAIFFLDEVHDVLNPRNKYSDAYQSGLKELLDPDNEYIQDDGLKEKINVSHCIFLLAGNLPPSDTEGALLNRMQTYFFSPATGNARQLIAEKALADAKAQFGFTSIDKRDKTFQNIVAYDKQHCSEDGVRPLRAVVRNYVRLKSALSQNIIRKQEFNIEHEFKIARGTSLSEYKKKDQENDQ